MPNPVIALMIGLGLVGVGVLLFWPNGGLVGWWQRSRRMTTRVITEDALKHIEKTDMHGEKATLQSLAGELHISMTQAADLVMDLQKQELLDRSKKEKLEFEGILTNKSSLLA